MIIPEYVRAMTLRHMAVALFVMVILSTTCPSVAAQETETIPALTANEQHWLRQRHETIRLGITVIPPQILRGKNGYEGLSLDYIHLLEHKLGCQFTLVPYDTWNEVIQAAKARDIDMIFAAQQTPERLEYLTFTDSYIDLQNVIIVRNDRAERAASLKDMHGWTVAASKGSAVHEFLRKEHPDLTIRPVENEVSGLTKVSFGEIDAMVVEPARASYYIEKEGLTNLRVVGEAGLLYQLRFAVRNDWPELRDILDKGLACLTDDERRRINRRWIIVGERSLFERREFWISLAIVVGLALSAAMAVWIWTRTLRLMVRKATAQLHQELAAREQAERILRDQEERHRSTLASMTDLVFLLDADGRFIDYHTPNAMALYRSPAEFLGHHIADVLPPHLVSALLDGIACLRKGEATRRIDYELDIADRHTCWSANLSPRHDSTGQFAGITVVARDMTEQRRMEDHLRQSEKMEAIGQLAGGIAHDFNNQLCGILGYADMLTHRLDRYDDPKLKQHALNICTAAKRAADLTEQLLAFARRGKFLSTPVDLHHVIREVAEFLTHSIDKRIVISQHLDAASALVLGDPTQLQNVLLNLGLNARDAMPQGGELIFCTRTIDFNAPAPEKDLAAGRYLDISVTDSGCGMDEQTRKHIFEPFFTTKDVGKGTGLGLASAYGTMKTHRGAIRVYSEPGRGSTFHLFLPLLESPDTAAQTAELSAAPQPGRGRILVVDDETTLLNVIQELLTELEYHVTTCADPVQALELYRRDWRSVDLVILDMVMPRLSGKDVFLAMRDINPQVRVLLSSGYSLNHEAQSILDAGALAFMQKPFTQADLARKLSEALRT